MHSQVHSHTQVHTHVHNTQMSTQVHNMDKQVHTYAQVHTHTQVHMQVHNTPTDTQTRQVYSKKHGIHRYTYRYSKYRYPSTADTNVGTHTSIYTGTHAKKTHIDIYDTQVHTQVYRIHMHIPRYTVYTGTHAQ